MCVAALLEGERASVSRRAKGTVTGGDMLTVYRRLVFVVLDFVALCRFVWLCACRDVWCVRGCRQCGCGCGRRGGLWICTGGFTQFTVEANKWGLDERAPGWVASGVLRGEKGAVSCVRRGQRMLRHAQGGRSFRMACSSG
jgi:hypothetical protein